VRILWLKTELLHPVDKGGKIRTYQMLKELKREHHITYLTLDDGMADREAREKSVEYCNELVCVPHDIREKFTAGFYADLALNVISSLPYAIRKYQSTEMRRLVDEHVKAQLADIVVCDFLAPAVNMPPGLTCPAVLFQHNVEAMIWQRHYEVQANPVKKFYLREQWQKMRSFERDACRRFDAVVAVYEEDRETMKRDYPLEQVYDVPTRVYI
jgi:hypothetical protein